MAAISPPRILLLADAFPWPARDGYRIRLNHVIKALADAGSLDLFGVARAGSDFAPPPADIPVLRWGAAVAPGRPVTRRLLARTLSTPLPRRVLWRDWSAARRELGQWSESPMTWRGAATPIRSPDWDGCQLAPLCSTPTTSKTCGFARSISTSPRPRGCVGPGAVDSSVQTRGALPPVRPARDVRRRTLGASSAAAGRRVDATIVCSELDRRRLEVPNAVVIPNGYEERAGAAGATNGKVMSMVGLFHYGPNSDGARYFVQDVLPQVRACVPDSTVRFIGRHDGHLGDLSEAAGVETTGEVAMSPPSFGAPESPSSRSGPAAARG